MRCIHRQMLRLLFCVLALALLAGVAGCGKENDLSVIKERGTLVVGTSADYPPMEYVVDGEFEGFDMDLIREVGERMGVKVEIQDMAFDTLIAALKQGKVDVLIAAMSATPERLEQADFSDVYHRSMHGFLVKTGSGVQLDDGPDVAAYKTGVQTGTSHEKWIMGLVEEGLMEENNIYRYEKADIAILDVAAGRLDIFIADLPVAKAFDKKMDDVEIALEYNVNPTHGGNRIAVRKGSTELAEELNRILHELDEEGFLEQLAEEHLSEPE